MNMKNLKAFESFSAPKYTIWLNERATRLFKNATK
jgi:hypothetical protein